MVVPWKVRECFIKNVILEFNVLGVTGLLLEEGEKVNLDGGYTMPGDTEKQKEGSIGLSKGRGARNEI